MGAARSWRKPVGFILIFSLCFNSGYQLTDLQVCNLCGGTVLNDTAVGQFCSLSAGRIDGRCCLRDDKTDDPERIIGLDLSNCSLTCVQDLQAASAALMIDLSLNPIVTINDTAFQGFTMNCPENSLCAPFGPGFFECSCADNFHGYKCLREGEFPTLKVFGPLAASTVVISFLLWATQRRKAKSL